MKGWQKGLLIVGATATVATGAMWAFEPERPGTQKGAQQEVERQMGDLADADEMNKDRMRERGMDGVDMENRQKLAPHEPRPPRPHVRVPFP